MEYRTHKSETISEIGLGGYALSGVYGKKDPQQFVGLVQRAYDLGVTFFDVADVYGTAEEILGRAVAPFRDQVWIATKLGASSEGQIDCSAEHVLSACEQSLKRLQTDHIDLYQIHFDDPGTPVEETVEALEELRTAGKIRYYGVGHLSPRKLEAYFECGPIFSALVELSAASRGALQRKVPTCRDHGVGVIAFSTTGRGLLTGAIGPGHVFEAGDIRHMDALFQRERFASGLRILERLRTLGTKYGKTPAQVAIAWVLAQPGILCALTGPSTIRHLEENIESSDLAIAPDDLEALGGFLQREDQRVRQEQLQSVRAILEQELDADRAFSDLVYVLESLAEIEFATEAEIMAVFQRLLSLRRQEDAQALEQMQEIQAELRARYL